LEYIPKYLRRKEGRMNIKKGYQGRNKGGKTAEGRNKRRKEGRKEGRKAGRKKEGRKEARHKGRKEGRNVRATPLRRLSFGRS
jgi:hypothetical protein